MIELSPPGGSERYEACKKDTPPKPSVSGFGGERRSSGMSDTCRTAAGGSGMELAPTRGRNGFDGGVAAGIASGCA